MGGPLSSFTYGVDLGFLPRLGEAFFGFGLPLVFQAHANLTTFRAEHWACRTLSNGELPPPMAIMAGADLHLDAHRQLIRLVRHLGNLKIFEITNCRVCNHLLTGYTYTDIDDAMTRTMQGLPAVILQHSTKLVTFKMTTKIFAAGQNGGMWLYRGYHNSFGTFTGYNHLEDLEMDCCFFFEGRPVPQPGMPIVTAHPPVLLTELGDSVKKIAILNLVEGYLGQFYQFLERVLSEKASGGLAELKEVAYTTLVPNAVFPPAGSPRTLAQLQTDLAAQGVTLAWVS
jgi:hypothetical protein